MLATYVDGIHGQLIDFTADSEYGQEGQTNVPTEDIWAFCFL